MTPAELETLGERISKGAAPTLAAAVHRGDGDTVAALLDRLSRQELYAVAVALAAEIVIDDVAVERVLDGERQRLTMPERAAATAVLVERGQGPAGIAKRLRTSGSLAKRLYTALPRTNPTTTEGTAA